MKEERDTRWTERKQKGERYGRRKREKERETGKVDSDKDTRWIERER